MVIVSDLGLKLCVLIEYTLKHLQGNEIIIFQMVLRDAIIFIMWDLQQKHHQEINVVFRLRFTISRNAGEQEMAFAFRIERERKIFKVIKVEMDNIDSGEQRTNNLASVFPQK